MKALHFILLVGFSALVGAHSSESEPFDAGDDLSLFVTQPNLRPPKFDISYIDHARVTPGYWFTAPFSKLLPDDGDSTLKLCQVGPTIFDQRGELVWSGACEFNNVNVFDFKVTSDGSLSFLLDARPEVDGLETRGAGIIMDNTYSQQMAFYPSSNGILDEHEFTRLDDGNVLIMKAEIAYVDVSMIGSGSRKAAEIFDGGFQERDGKTGKVLFDWNARDHMNLTESNFVRLASKTAELEESSSWDWIHMNSVDKNKYGDYLISARYTDSVFKVSGKDGSVLWRLGGTQSSFYMDGFTFSRQHDARFISEHGDKTVISLFDDAADTAEGINVPTAKSSAAVLIELDTRTMTAKALKTFNRPDGGLTHRMGNFQLLEDEHAFVCWSENGYLTEFDQDNNVVMEAKFASTRLQTYRAFKFNFTGHPTEPMAVKSFAYGASTEDAINVYHVSWNGATEIVAWNFYGSNLTGNNIFLGQAPKTGFETMFTAKSHHPAVYVEAIAADGQILGSSEPELTELPMSWDLLNCPGNSCYSNKLPQQQFIAPPNPAINLVRIDEKQNGLTARYVWLAGSIGLIVGGALALIAQHLRARRDSLHIDGHGEYEPMLDEEKTSTPYGRQSFATSRFHLPGSTSPSSSSSQLTVVCKEE